jgi:acyl carrier protein phosphodiesterase
MNFLGHCYLCQNNLNLITGNLGGDFYKGNLKKFNDLPEHILDGVKLHRFIDNYTDQSDQIRSVASIFKNEGISKVSFIACDILLDHYLSKNWIQFSKSGYIEFIRAIYSEVEKNKSHMTDDFRFLFNKMQQYGWFYEYPTIEGIALILRQFSSRLGFNNSLPDSIQVYLNNQKTIDSYFESFVIDIKNASNEFIFANKLGIS